jgi:hypothetical protein
MSFVGFRRSPASLNLIVRGRTLHFAPGLSLILLGCTGVTTGLFAARRVLQQGDWLRIPGRVESGAIVGTGETYTARVVYNYTVDGVQLTGNVVKPGAVEYNWRGPEHDQHS